VDLGNRAFYKLSRGLSHGVHQDGRLLIAAMVGVYLVTVAGARAIFSIDLWPHLGVPVGPSLFFDGRNVAAAAECRDLGFNPLVHNPCDPWGRPMVYPRVWLALRWLGLEESHTIALGVVAGVLFLGTLMLLLGRLTVGEGVVAGLAACSPATMFAIERANMDLVVFAITASAVVAWRFRRGSYVAPILVLCAAIAKIYPVFGLVAFLWGRGRKALLVGLGCLAVFLFYVVMTLPDIQAITASAPQGEYYSYGARILVARLYHLFVPAGIGSDVIKQIVAAAPLALGAVALWIAARRKAPPLSIRQSVSAPLLAFHLGVFIYVGSFLSGNNFDYRLIYLFLTLPQLFEWIMGAHNADLRSKLAGVALVVVVAEMWISALSEQIFLADEALSWALAGLLITLFALSTPPVSSIWRSLMGRAELPSTESPVPATDG
jgi:hypothetical protein